MKHQRPKRLVLPWTQRWLNSIPNRQQTFTVSCPVLPTCSRPWPTVHQHQPASCQPARLPPYQSTGISSVTDLASVIISASLHYPVPASSFLTPIPSANLSSSVPPPAMSPFSPCHQQFSSAAGGFLQSVSHTLLISWVMQDLPISAQTIQECITRDAFIGLSKLPHSEFQACHSLVDVLSVMDTYKIDGQLVWYHELAYYKQFVSGQDRKPLLQPSWPMTSVSALCVLCSTVHSNGGQ